jgi:N-acetylmuramoyl-L-alanine amidase
MGAQAAPGLRLVVIDPGHGGTNDGAPARFAAEQFEKTYTLVIAQLMAAHLRAEDVQVILTRVDDRELGLRDRIYAANRLGADVFISVHLNSSERPGPSGFGTFFLTLEATDETTERLATFENQEGSVVSGHTAQRPQSTSAVDHLLQDLTATQAHHDAHRLAKSIQQHLEPLSPFANRGVKQGNFGVLKGAAMPAVVFEGGFLNHKREGRWITSVEGQTSLALGAARGILAFGRDVLALRKKRAHP